MLVGLSMLDYIESRLNGTSTITLEEFTAAMQSGDEAERKEAVERMLAAGGYEALQ